MNIEIGNFNIKAILPSYMSCATPDKIRPRWDPVRINVRIYVSCVYVPVYLVDSKVIGV